jgi:O-antigen ligase
MINININILKNEFLYIRKKNYPITIKLIYILSIFVPAFAITGPFLPDLSICIIGILFIIFTIKQKGVNLKAYKKYISFFLILYLILILSAINSSYHQQSFKIFFFIRFFIYFLAIVYLINELKNYKYVFFETLKIIFYVLIFDSIFQYFFHFNLLGITPIMHFAADANGKIYTTADGREVISSIIITSFFGDEKVLGSYLVRLFPIFIYLFFCIKKKIITKDFAYIIILATTLIFLVILSNERTAIFYSIFIFSLTLFFFNFYKKRYILYIFLILIPLSIFAFNINNSLNRIYHTYEQLKPDNSFVFFSSTHQKYANSSIEIFKKNILLGSGPKTFLLACENSGFTWKNDECNIHPHNIFFQVLSEVGLLGTIIYFYLLIIFCKLFIKYIKEKNKKIFLLISIIMFLNPVIPSGNLFNNWFNIINWISIPFIFSKRDDY